MTTSTRTKTRPAPPARPRLTRGVVALRATTTVVGCLGAVVAFWFTAMALGGYGDLVLALAGLVGAAGLIVAAQTGLVDRILPGHRPTPRGKLIHLGVTADGKPLTVQDTIAEITPPRFAPEPRRSGKTVRALPAAPPVGPATPPPGCPPPSDELPAEFRHIVHAAWMMDDAAADLLQELYEDARRNPDFVQAEETYRYLCTQHRAYVDLDSDAYAADIDPRNPAVYLDEMDGISGGASAIASYALLVDRYEDEQAFALLAAPWFAAGRSFQYGTQMLHPDGRIENLDPNPATNPAAVPMDDLLNFISNRAAAGETKAPAPARRPSPRPLPVADEIDLDLED